MKAPDDNDRHKAGTLPADPGEDLEAVTPPDSRTLTATAAEFRTELEERRSGKRKALPTGLAPLDAKLDGGLRQGLYLLAAPPGAGKTTLALQIAAHVARRTAAEEPRPVLFVALEMPRWDLETRLVAARLRWAWPKIRGAEHLDPAEVETVLRARDELAAECPALEIVEGAHGYMTADGLEAEVARVTAGGAAPLVIVDYLQALAPDGNWKGDRRNAVGHNAYRLKTLSTAHKVPVIALSSVARDWYKASPDKGDSRDKPDTALAYLGAGKESGDAEFAADAVIYLDAEEAESSGLSPVRIVVAKNRGGERGIVGPLWYDGARGRFAVDRNELAKGTRV